MHGPREKVHAAKRLCTLHLRANVGVIRKVSTRADETRLLNKCVFPESIRRCVLNQARFVCLMHVFHPDKMIKDLQTCHNKAMSPVRSTFQPEVQEVKLSRKVRKERKVASHRKEVQSNTAWSWKPLEKKSLPTAGIRRLDLCLF